MRIVLVDGLWGWSQRMRWLAWRLEKLGCGSVEIFSYDASGLGPIEREADRFANNYANDDDLRVVGHSLGGILIRTAAMRSPGLALKRSVFINSPHSGSLVAHCLPLPGIRQLQPGSKLMRLLADQPWSAKTLAVWCPGDLMVLPGHSARWEKADELMKCDLPLHNWPLISPTFHRRIARFLTHE